MNQPKKYQIMVIEDSDDDFYATKRALQSSQSQSELIRFVSAEDGIRHLFQAVNMPDLILMDLNLPGQSGIEATRKIKSQNTYKDIPIVMLSSSPNAKDIEEAYRAGVVQYLHKSFDVNVYFNHIRDVTRQCLDSK
ncbi:MAG: response regulator [Alphaproteobacteria bacterium]|nr:response regulator [Alphaproteobacteria bacterium]